VSGEVRLARYTNNRPFIWTQIGARVNRNSAAEMKLPTAEIGPQVGIDVQGDGVVSWLEPDELNFDTVWARRVFGGTTGIPLRVSPSSGANADAFSLDVAGFGWGAVALRQPLGGVTSPPRVLVSLLPDVFTSGATTFGAPVPADGGVLGGLGRPSAAVSQQGLFLTGFGSGSATLASWGDEFSLLGTQRIDTGASGIDGTPQVDLAESGAGVAAWRELRGSTGLMRVQERRADGVNESTTLSAPGGGSVGPPAFGGSGLGDGIVAWTQGSGSSAKIAAAVVDAPPDTFLVLVPKGRQCKKKIPLAWDPAPHAIGGVTYSVSVDDEPILGGIGGLGTRLRAKRVGKGRHRIQVFALDSAGQETGSLVGKIQVGGKKKGKGKKGKGKGKKGKSRRAARAAAEGATAAKKKKKAKKKGRGGKCPKGGGKKSKKKKRGRSKSRRGR
jgi:hypothetical protein